MNIRPLGNRIVIRRIEQADQVGLIHIPDNAKEKPQQGEVVAVGKGFLTESGAVIPVDVKVGDRVLFAKYGGADIKIEGTDFLILREEEILGVLEKAATAKK